MRAQFTMISSWSVRANIGTNVPDMVTKNRM
jgi:hypothetical protein